jgi:hypothetical protein
MTNKKSSRKLRTTKNLRRVRAADNALNRVVGRARRRSKINIPRPMRMGSQLTIGPRAMVQRRNAAEYIAKLCCAQPTGTKELPCQFPKPYQEVRCQWTCSPVWNSTGEAYVVFNPSMLWTDKIQIVVDAQAGDTGGINTNFVAPVCGSSTTIASNGRSFKPTYTSSNSPDPSWGSGVGILPLGSGVTSGDVRFLGAHVRIETFNSVTSTGGKLWITHNPQNIPLITFEGAASTSTATDWQYNPLHAVFSVVQNTAVSCLEDPKQGVFCYNVLPHTTEFEPANSNLAPIAGQSALAWQSLFQQAMTAQAEVFPPDWTADNFHSYTQGILITAPPNLALPTALTDSGMTVTITGHFHINLDNSATAGGAWTAQASQQLLAPGVSDPLAAGAINAALTTIKQKRAAAPSTVTTSSTKQTEKADVQDVVSAVADAAPDIANMISNFVPPTMGAPLRAGAAVLKGITTLFGG